MSKPRTLSGIKPTGEPHLGNYLGFIRPALAMQGDFETFYFIADYHALTAPTAGDTLRRWSYDLVATFAALGMDFESQTFFRQSDVPEVTELAWFLSCVTPFGLLERAHAFKDHRARGEDVNHGLVAYPVLMAADILLYEADEVPVGRDQQQHLEITRDIAQRFNHRYGDTLKLPRGRIAEDVGAVRGLDGRKMSKSYGNTIPLFAPAEALRKAVMRMRTDSRSVADPKEPENCHVYQLFSHFASAAMRQHWAMRYRQGGMGYGEIKQATAEAIEAELAPARTRYQTLRANEPALEAILIDGAQRARHVARGVLGRVREAIGLQPFPQQGLSFNLIKRARQQNFTRVLHHETEETPPVVAKPEWWKISPRVLPTMLDLGEITWGWNLVRESRDTTGKYLAQSKPSQERDLAQQLLQLLRDRTTEEPNATLLELMQQLLQLLRNPTPRQDLPAVDAPAAESLSGVLPHQKYPTAELHVRNASGSQSRGEMIIANLISSRRILLPRTLWAQQNPSQQTLQLQRARAQWFSQQQWGHAIEKLDALMQNPLQWDRATEELDA